MDGPAVEELGMPTMRKCPWGFWAHCGGATQLGTGAWINGVDLIYGFDKQLLEFVGKQKQLLISPDGRFA